MNIEARISLSRGSDFTLAIDTTIPAQGLTAIFGPSGCGKTTLLRVIAGLENCTDCFIKVGETVWQNGRKMLPAHRRPIGYVFQEPSLFPHLTARQNIEYGQRRIPIREQRIAVDSAIDLLRLEKLLERRPASLSGGERQRVAIARALAVSPRLLLMDEPLAALDLQRKREIMPYLEKLHRKLDMPILYVTHSPGEVARLADRILLLENGRLRAHGPTVELFNRPDLPFIQSDRAAALIEATVAGHDEKYALTLLEFSGGEFAVSRKALPVGHRARLRVIARDVSLTLKRQSDTSILNIFPATVTAIRDENEAQVMVHLRIGDATLLSRITRKSADTLRLAPGDSVFAQVKSVALLS